MKKLLILALLILSTSVCLPTTSYAQGLRNGSLQSPAESKPVDRNAILNKLLEEGEAQQELKKQHQARIVILEAEVKAADDAHQVLTEAYKKALIEIGELRAQVKFLEKAEEQRKEQVALLRQEIAGLRGELKAARRRELLGTVKDVVLSAIWILKR